MEPGWLKAARANGLIIGEVGVGPVGKSPAVRGRLTVRLPYPPTVNTYWRRVGAKTLISAGGRAYRRAVLAELRLVRFGAFDGPLSVAAVFHPPDGRRRDLDNLPKALLDALQAAGVYADDSQVRHLDLRFAPAVAGGLAVVTVGEFEEVPT